MSDNRQVLLEIATRAQELTYAETAVLALAEDNGQTVYYAAAVGKHADVIVDRRGQSANSGLCGVAFQGSDPVLVCDTTGDRRVHQDYVEALGITTALAVPLRHNNELLGAIMVLNRVDGQPFNAQTEQTLATYAQKAATQLQSAIAQGAF
jgi:GAF domain-containing protein